MLWLLSAASLVAVAQAAGATQTQIVSISTDYNLASGSEAVAKFKASPDGSLILVSVTDFSSNNSIDATVKTLVDEDCAKFNTALQGVQSVSNYTTKDKLSDIGSGVWYLDMLGDNSKIGDCFKQLKASAGSKNVTMLLTQCSISNFMQTAKTATEERERNKRRSSPTPPPAPRPSPTRPTSKSNEPKKAGESPEAGSNFSSPVGITTVVQLVCVMGAFFLTEAAILV